MFEFGHEIQSIVERLFEHRVRFHSSASKELERFLIHKKPLDYGWAGDLYQ
jgi:hypothetical protein